MRARRPPWATSSSPAGRSSCSIAPASADFDRASGRRPRRRSADDAVPRHRGADRDRSRHESSHVGEQGDTGQRRRAESRAACAFSGPRSGNQACGEIGAGRMWEPNSARSQSARAAGQRGPAGRRQCADHRGTDPRASRPGALPHQPQLRKDGLCHRRGRARGRRAT